MTKVKKALTGIGITLLVLLILAAIIFGIVYYSFSHWFAPGSAYTDYDYLKRVMADDVVYLSDEFITENNLTFDKGALIDEDVDHFWTYNFPEKPVVFYMNLRNVHGVQDYTQRVENLDKYTYYVKNANKEDMPIYIRVSGIVGKDANIKTKCNQKTADGYNYGMTYGGELEDTGSGIYKEVVVRTNANKSLFNKKNCILTVGVSIDKKDAQNYSDEEIIAKFDKILNSALSHIERYED